MQTLLTRKKVSTFAVIIGMHEEKIDIFQYASLDILQFSLIVRTRGHKQNQQHDLSISLVCVLLASLAS